LTLKLHVFSYGYSKINGLWKTQYACKIINEQLHIYPEVIVEEAVYDWIDEAVGHGKPVDRVVYRNEELPLVFSLVVGQLGIVVHHKDEYMKWQPADAEQNNDG